MWINDRSKTKCFLRQVWEKDKTRVLHETWTQRVTDEPASLPGTRFLGAPERGHVTGNERPTDRGCKETGGEPVWQSFLLPLRKARASRARGSLARLPRISRLAKGETETTASRLPRGELGHFLCAFFAPCKGIRFPESWKFLHVVSGILEIFASRIRNLGNFCM